MTVHDKKPAAPHGGGTPIARLRIREAALRHQAAQLQARAEHLQRVAHSQAQRLQRRIDAHEKIVLGALLWLASALNRPENDVVSVPERQRLRHQGHQALNRGR